MCRLKIEPRTQVLVVHVYHVWLLYVVTIFLFVDGEGETLRVRVTWEGFKDGTARHFMGKTKGPAWHGHLLIIHVYGVIYTLRPNMAAFGRSATAITVFSPPRRRCESAARMPYVLRGYGLYGGKHMARTQRGKFNAVIDPKSRQLCLGVSPMILTSIPCPLTIQKQRLRPTTYSLDTKIDVSAQHLVQKCNYFPECQEFPILQYLQARAAANHCRFNTKIRI